MAAKLKDLRAKLRQRMHEAPRGIGTWLEQVVRGCFQYHAIPGNRARLQAFRKDVQRMWYQTLRRRSQRCRLTGERFVRSLGAMLPPVQILQPYPSVRFDAKYSNIRGKNRVREQRPHGSVRAVRSNPHPYRDPHRSTFSPSGAA